ncbi:hypothetical protein BCR34DRAFT_89674 [Clohesyomyces aquaticus]|uniref:Uncharacterized protein n=1 Tax=Clohesyomyces aquaticus TaxID=1231657 RepID=A0A1Y1YVL2_9PLEO|nr:hypothetical protein BCR34DRAFT_89674 [Clohesyomyces aquaticus]
MCMWISSVLSLDGLNDECIMWHGIWLRRELTRCGLALDCWNANSIGVDSARTSHRIVTKRRVSTSGVDSYDLLHLPTRIGVEKSHSASQPAPRSNHLGSVLGHADFYPHQTVYASPLSHLGGLKKISPFPGGPTSSLFSPEPRPDAKQDAAQLSPTQSERGRRNP